jgi:hypothetical protein
MGRPGSRRVVDERQKYLEGACGSDEEVRRLVDKRPKAQSHVEQFLEKPLGIDTTAKTRPLVEGLGTPIGPLQAAGATR